MAIQGHVDRLMCYGESPIIPTTLLRNLFALIGALYFQENHIGLNATCASCPKFSSSFMEIEVAR